ncbi:C40 family peptidase [Streptomyces olivaceoviridis]|uniref:C40 family peptidase n=1 Tax=Streptomyces olivaceoviridis TaxID=1921 RepID=A0ABW7VD43_STROI|nr:C40 family peptidase [Streptomyces corchorusii]
MAPESRDEVRQRIASLYDRAENDTGNFNATRAMAARTRSRGVPLAKRADRRPDPALDEVARQWFDAVRADVGPTVPAVLPADRRPDRSAAPTRSRGRMDGLPPAGGEREARALPAGGSEPLVLPRGASEGLGLPALPAGGRETRALPSGERRALGTGGLPEQRPAALESHTGQTVAELTTGPVTDPTGGSLPALETGRTALVDTASSMELPGTALGLSGGTTDTAGWGATDTVGWDTAEVASPDVLPVVLPVVAQPAAQRAAVQLPRTLPGSAGFVRLSPAASKAGIRRRLDTARDLLSGRTARLGPPDGAVASAAPMAAAPPVGITAPMTDTGSLPLPLPLPQPLPAPASVESSRALRAAKAIAFARAQLGKPCVWGATGPDSYDCSSLTQAAWKAAGVTLPRAAHEQALAGTPLTTAGLEPGDLVLFFQDDRHVGLYVGDGMMVHAPGPGSSVREESIYGAGEAAIHRIVRPA